MCGLNIGDLSDKFVARIAKIGIEARIGDFFQIIIFRYYNIGWLMKDAGL